MSDEKIGQTAEGLPIYEEITEYNGEELVIEYSVEESGNVIVEDYYYSTDLCSSFVTSWVKDKTDDMKVEKGLV